MQRSNAPFSIVEESVPVRMARSESAGQAARVAAQASAAMDGGGDVECDHYLSLIGSNQ